MYFNRRSDLNRPETVANFGIFAVNQILGKTLFFGYSSGVYALVGLASPWKIPSTVGSFLILVLAVDFLYYWKHRFEHEIRFLWAYHSVHHSSVQYNLSTAIRLPFIGPFFSSWFFWPLALVGFSPIAIVAAYQIVLLYQFWIHTETITSLGYFDSVFNSPSNHRVHHGKNPRYLDKNHGGILILWDKLFGTFEPETEKPSYGVTVPILTTNPVKINFLEPQKMICEVKTELFHGSPRGALKAVVGRP